MQTKETHYSLLGISQDATYDDIRIAYRRIAKVLHPDVSQLPDAQERFQAVQLAHSVLSDKQKREEYDKALASSTPYYGDSIFQHYDGPFSRFYSQSKTRNPPINGETVNTRYTFTTADVLVEKTVSLEFTHRDLCDGCKGEGQVPATSARACSACDGKGFTIESYLDPTIGRLNSKKPCTVCKGTGRSLLETCQTCSGNRYELVHKVVTFKLSADTYHGKIVRIKGEGGKAFDGGTPGDILITLERSLKDTAIVTEQGDVHFFLIVPPEKLFYDKHIKIELPDNTVQSFELRGNRPGTQIVLPGKGFMTKANRRGNLIYTIYPDLPKEMRK